MKMRFASFKGCFSEHCGVDHVGRPLISKPHKLHRRQQVVSARRLRTWPRATIRANLPHRVRPYELRCSDPCSLELYQGTLFAYRTEPHPRGCEALHCARLSGGFSIIPASRQLVAQDHHKSVRERCSEDARWRDALPRQGSYNNGRRRSAWIPVRGWRSPLARASPDGPPKKFLIAKHWIPVVI